MRRNLNRDRQRVVLTIQAGLSAVADAFRYQDVQLEPISPRQTQAVLMVDSWQWLLLDLAMLDTDFTIHEPASFQSACQRFATRLAGGVVAG